MYSSDSKKSDNAPFSNSTSQSTIKNGSTGGVTNIKGKDMMSDLTRPSNLPPKSKEEEEAHRKMYEEMVRQYEKKENEKRKREEQIQKMKEKRILDNQKLWKENIIPKWESMRHHKTTVQLAWDGIPPNIRSTIWKLAIGNDLNITPSLFNICINHANTAKLDRSDGNENKMSSVNNIPLDLPRTFPALAFYQPGGPHHENLKRVLEAYVFYRPDIGYVQGMSYLAAILLLYMNEIEAFKCISNILNRKCHMAFYQLDSDINIYCAIFSDIFEKNLPALYRHFSDIGLSPEMYLLDWILTIYSKSLPLDISTRIWDIFLIEGDVYLFRVAIGLLKLVSKEILSSGFELEECKKMLTTIPASLIEDDAKLFEEIRKVDINSAKFTSDLEQAIGSV